MALKIYKFSDPSVYLLIDNNTGSFRVISKTDTSDVITKEQAEDFVNFINGDEVQSIVSAIRSGAQLDELHRTAVYAFDCSEYSATNFMNVSITINTPSMVNWTAVILRDEGVTELGAGVINDLYTYITTKKLKPDGGYYIIKPVEQLPDPATRTDIAYMLTKTDVDKPAGTTWRWNGQKWLALTEGYDDDPDPIPPPPPEPDPLDPDTYPDSDVKPEEPQAIGGDDVDVCEVVDGNITQNTTITSNELAFVVNCTMGDGCMNIVVS